MTFFNQTIATKEPLTDSEYAFGVSILTLCAIGIYSVVMMIVHHNKYEDKAVYEKIIEITEMVEDADSDPDYESDPDQSVGYESDDDDSEDENDSIAVLRFRNGVTYYIIHEDDYSLVVSPSEPPVRVCQLVSAFPRHVTRTYPEGGVVMCYEDDSENTGLSRVTFGDIKTERARLALINFLKENL